MLVCEKLETEGVFAAAFAALQQSDPVNKANATVGLNELWLSFTNAQQQRLCSDKLHPAIISLPAPGRPEKPALVDPHTLPRRGLGSQAGRIALLHSLAHIEFNAINLALDAVYRFRDMPLDYVTDWLRVASEEGQHFLMVCARLADFDAHYGDYNAHDGLWDMARRTEHDVLVRMALVPRILEARGLDVAPPMMEKLERHGDGASAAILQRIYTDEITHVAVGNRWFKHVCDDRQLDGCAVFKDLLQGKNSGYLKSPYNDAARLQAGFTAAEMAVIREMEHDYRQLLP